jgi:hypothetical protein
MCPAVRDGMRPRERGGGAHRIEPCWTKPLVRDGAAPPPMDFLFPLATVAFPLYPRGTTVASTFSAPATTQPGPGSALALPPRPAGSPAARTPNHSPLPLLSTRLSAGASPGG